MKQADVELVAWGVGDRTVGDGTYHARVTLDCFPDDMIPYLKECMADALKVWDLASKRITVMTKDEYEAYTRADGR